MNVDLKTVKNLVDILKEKNDGPAPYDTEAEVMRIEGDTAWVHIPGGVDETPVAIPISAEPGDKVRVRVSGGQAWITGNDTAPPTNDKTALEAQKVAELAVDNVKVLDENLNQKGIFNRLTNNGTIEGLFMVDNDLYVNASYIHSGTLTLGGNQNENGLLEVYNGSNVLTAKIDKDGIYAIAAEFENYIVVDGNADSLIRMTKDYGYAQLYHAGLLCADTENDVTAEYYSYIKIAKSGYRAAMSNTSLTFDDNGATTIPNPTSDYATQITKGGLYHYASGTQVVRIHDGITVTGKQYPFIEKFTNVESRIGQTAPSATEYFDVMYCYDKNDRVLFYMEGQRNTSNVMALTYGLRRYSANGSTAYTNYIQLSINNSGTASVSLSHPAAWKTALGI